MKWLEISLRRLGDCFFVFDDEAADDCFLCDEEKGFRDVGLSGLYRLF